MAEIIRIRVSRTEKVRESVFFTVVNIVRFGSIPNVKVLSSTLVKLYLARNPLLRASLWAMEIFGLGRMRRTISSASKNLKVAFVFVSVFGFVR